MESAPCLNLAQKNELFNDLFPYGNNNVIGPCEIKKILTKLWPVHSIEEMGNNAFKVVGPNIMVSSIEIQTYLLSISKELERPIAIEHLNVSMVAIKIRQTAN